MSHQGAPVRAAANQVQGGQGSARLLPSHPAVELPANLHRRPKSWGNRMRFFT